MTVTAIRITPAANGLARVHTFYVGGSSDVSEPMAPIDAIWYRRVLLADHGLNSEFDRGALDALESRLPKLPAVDRRTVRTTVR